MIRAFRRSQDTELQNLIDLAQYQEPIPTPPTIVIEDNNVFYDTPTSFLDWLPPYENDPVQFDQPSSSPSSSINSLVDSLMLLTTIGLFLLSQVKWLSSTAATLD